MSESSSWARQACKASKALECCLYNYPGRMIVMLYLKIKLNVKDCRRRNIFDN